MTEHTELTAEQVVLWLTESMNNASHIASTKSGQDKAGWLDDARYLKAAIDMVAKSSVGAGGAVAKCCGDFDSLVDSAECRSCPARQHYLTTATPSVSAGGAVAQGMPSRTRCEHGVWAADYCYRCGAPPVTPSTAQEALPESQILGIASAGLSESLAEGGPRLKHFVRAIKAGIRAHCLALRKGA